MWRVLVLTQDELAAFGAVYDNLSAIHECRITHGREYSSFVMPTITIEIYKYVSVDSIIKLRGHKAHVIFTDYSLFLDTTIHFTLRAMCVGKSVNVYPIENFYDYMSGRMPNMYDYKKAMINDIKDWVIENDWVSHNFIDGPDGYLQMLDNLYDTLWDHDEITGNGPNYYDTEKQCEKYIIENLPLYFEAAREYEDFPTKTQAEWEPHEIARHMDAVIRCYLLRDCIEEACEEL